MDKIGRPLSIIASLIIIVGVAIAVIIKCEDQRKEFSYFNVNLAKGLTEYLTKTGKKEYIAATENRYELANIRNLNANLEIMEGLRENLSAIYFSIQQLSSWQFWFCPEG